MRPFRRIFWTGLAIRLACVPFLLQWFHADERQMLEFAHFHAHGRLHPFLESRLHLRNQTLPWLFSHGIRILDALGLSGPRVALFLMDSAIAVWTWLGFWALLSFFKEEGERAGKDFSRPVFILSWFFALFWGFSFLYSRPLLEAVSFAPACFLLLAVQRRQAFRAGFWAGLAGILRYPSALWAVGAAAFWGARAWKAREKFEWKVAWLGAAGLALAIGLGGLADAHTYGQFLESAPSYWLFNRPGGPVAQLFGDDSLAVYWQWFAFLFTPWLAPAVIVGGAWALFRVPSLGLFCLPYLLGHLWTPHREPRFMLPLTPFLFLAIGLWSAGLKMPRWRLPTWVWDVVFLHLVINFVWFPLHAWAQWRSAQGVLLRHYSAIETEVRDLVTLSETLIDAWVPPQVRWGDAECRWHRPASVSESLTSRGVWVLARENPGGCVAVETAPVSSALPSLTERIFRVRFAGLWNCGKEEQVLNRLCPRGFAPAPEGEPLIARHLLGKVAP